MKRLKKYFRFLLCSLSNAFRRNVFIHYQARISRRAVIRVVNGGTIKINKHTEVLDFAMILTYGGSIEIGENCSINPMSMLYGHGNLRIGNNVLIAGGCMLIPANHVYSRIDVPINNQGLSKRGIVIEDDVWIGHGCSILDGVTIRKGCIIGAGTVVTKDTEPYSLYCGVPAVKIKSR